ncbi:MAG: FAD-dependent oxidoreductase [Gulosibacter sp.]|uniref:FAD-dependent oxidoreductase n=1 Tax=Gulosibacter sp. TaxID=2817531 RepID=UPI003F8EAE5A
MNHMLREGGVKKAIYALPGGRNGDHRGLKVALHNGGKVLPSAAQQDGQVDPANRQWVTDYVRKFIPGVVPEPYSEATCLFTNTPTEDFVLERVEGITIVSACSGHGAKFGPLIGLLAAGVATQNGAVPDEFRVPR